MGRRARRTTHRRCAAALPAGRGGGGRDRRRGHQALSRLLVPDRLPGIVDSHAHLQHEVFAHDLDAVLDRASAAGIVRILVPGWDRPSSEAALALAAAYPDLLDAAVGIHPHYAAAATPADWEAIETLAAERAARAVGEMGLDYFRNLSLPDVQRDALSRQLELAARVRKPVVIHDREAHADVTAALVAHASRMAAAAEPDRRPAGILHAFSGDAEMAAALIDAGYLISFALTVSFPKNLGPRAAAAVIPAGRFLVETDSPYLGVSRDTRNEPTTVLRTAAVLARLRDEPVEGIATAVAGAWGTLRGATSP